MKKELMFYNAYQDFYKMASKSEVFKLYCEKAFGEDFSQDGFSDVHQLNHILSIVDLKTDSCVLDIGCGNGKMLEYIQKKYGSKIFGFDYSENAIESAKQRMGETGEFQVALIGEADYGKNKFDLILSMDTIYFAPDISSFIAQIYQWLKPNGVFICGYQEGDVMKKTENQDTTMLAKAFKNNGLEYTVIDYTFETYKMLQRKREAIISMKDDFKKEHIGFWYKVVKRQTDCILNSYEEYRRENMRYIYMVKK